MCFHLFCEQRGCWVASLRVRCPCLKNKEARKLDLRVGSTAMPFKD